MRRAKERGAALVEAAFVLPLLILLVLGGVEFGFMINRGTLVNNAAREGAREAIFGSTEAEIEQRVLDAAPNLDPADITVTVSCLDPDGTPCSGAYDDASQPGGTAIVTVDYLYDFITPVTNLVGVGPTTNLSGTVEMRIEG